MAKEEKKKQKGKVEGFAVAEVAKARGEKSARLRERYAKEIVPALMKELGFKNVMEVPRLHKIVVNMGLGEAINNNKIIEGAQNQLAAITGQRTVVTRARKSIANFKLR